MGWRWGGRRWGRFLVDLEIQVREMRSINESFWISGFGDWARVMSGLGMLLVGIALFGLSCGKLMGGGAVASRWRCSVWR